MNVRRGGEDRKGKCVGMEWSPGGGCEPKGPRLWTLLWIAAPEGRVLGDRVRETARGRSKLAWVSSFLRRAPARQGSVGQALGDVRWV